MLTLGYTLKEHRERNSFTLRQVKKATGISNAYLSQLENDKIKKPSADVLYKLSSLYRIDLTDLLIASGKIKADPDYKSPGPFTTKKQELQKLSPKEEKELIQYLQFLRFKK